MDVRKSREDLQQQISFDKTEAGSNNQMMIRNQNKFEATPQTKFKEQDSMIRKDSSEAYKHQQKGALGQQQRTGELNSINNTLINLHQASLSSSFSLNNQAAIIHAMPLNQPIISINTTSNAQNFHLGDNGNDFSMHINQQLSQQQQRLTHQKSDQLTLDSNGNIIRGRKIDSPQLVVVRELRDLEDQEETYENRYLVQGLRYGALALEEELLRLNNREKSENVGAVSKSITGHAGKVQSKNKKHQSKSQESRKKTGHSSKSKKGLNTIKEEQSAKESSKVNNQAVDVNKQYQNIVGKGIKSSRDIRTSMGFNELLNHLDKDISLQQSNQMDFKNRTTHDLLKLELSVIKRQNSSNGHVLQQSKSQQKSKSVLKKKIQQEQPIKQAKSRSRERKPINQNDNQHDNCQSNTGLPKPILKKTADQKKKEQIFQYALNNVISDITPEKNQGVGSSFLQSEHGRCTTSQAVHQSQQYFQQNGRTLSQQNIGASQGLGSSQTNIIFSKVKNAYLQEMGSSSNAHKQHRDQSSPDRTGDLNHFYNMQYYGGGVGNQVKGFKPHVSSVASANIDKLVRDNIKKMKTKFEEEKIQKLQSEDKNKRKREMMEHNNNLVRMSNKEKTYRKQPSQPSHINLINNQQSQDFIPLQSDQLASSINANNYQMLKVSKWDEKFKLLNKQLKRDQFIQKSSQSQKLDLQKIKEGSSSLNNNNKHLIRKQQLNIKNHRKSYGLEFIEIKREIQDELKTIELKFKQDSSKTLSNEFTFQNQQVRNKASSGLNTEHSLKKLRIKASQKDGQLTKENTMNEFKSEKEEPSKIEKVIVIKKSKIRKFMKMKKKEKIKESNQLKKEEILRTIKMQENISKLNEYCKKNLQKSIISKKRNITILQNPNDQNQEDQQNIGNNITDFSKISGRRLVFDYSKNIKQNSHNYGEKGLQFTNQKHGDQDNDEVNDDSSRLSTDFYEEYFRLLNSIKKEKMQNENANSSTENFIDISNSHNITGSNILKSPNNKSMSALQISSSMTQKNLILSPKQLPKEDYTKHHQKSTQSQNKPLGKKTKSKSNLQELNGGKVMQKSQSKLQQQTLQGNMVVNSQNLKSKDRAESAPLLVGIQGKKKGTANSSKAINDTSIVTTGSKKKVKKSHINNQQNNLKVSDEDEHQAQNKNFRPHNQSKIEYIMNQIVKIQRAYREHLNFKGFYQQSNQTVTVNAYSSQEFQTQIPIEQHDIIERIQRINEELKEELEGSQGLHVQQNQSDFEEDMEDVQGEEPEEDCYEGEEEEEDEGESNMIIINQQSLEDEKKVVYLSNINSCSLPQTPKAEEAQTITSDTLNIQIQQNQGKKVFEYKAASILEPLNTYSHSSSVAEQIDIHQSISQKPSLESCQEIQTHIVDDKVKPHLQLQEEHKSSADYGMRLFTGSESLLREFKMNTPQQQHLQKQKESISESSLRNLTSHNSQASLNQRILQNQQSSVVESKKSNVDQTSHSSQSLFDRNSFQQFTMTKLQQMLKNNEFMNLIQMREKALEYRQDKESKFIRKMLRNKQLSPRTYNQKKEQLEKWVRLEKEEIQKTKKQFQEEWQKTIQIIEETQKNVDLMREKMKISIDNNKYHQQLFNSQSSRNSSSSYITSKKDDHNRKSILDQEDIPQSQRSFRLSILSQVQNFDSKIKNQKQLDLPPQSDNLIDFLEQSWQKSHKNEKLTLQDPESRQGIFIEDQKNLNLQQSQISDKQMEDGSLISPEAMINDLLKEQKHEQFIQEDERPLIRSRSEQDLSDLMKKNRLSIEELENYKDEHLNEKNQQDDGESFRVLESDRLNKNPFMILNQRNPDFNEIKIQENLFDESSNRYSKNDYQLPGNNDFESNDSLLNESDLNNYFQEQKFSIQDFKSLDKRKLIVDQEDEDELHGRQDSQVFFDKYDDSAINIQDDSMQDKQSTPFQQQSEIQKSINESSKDPENLYNEIAAPRSFTPDLVQSQTAIIQHQQALLFTNTKPGENIKIADILKKTQGLTDNNHSISFLNESHNNSQIVFQNQQINQSMQLPSLQPLVNDQEMLADKLTEEILQHILKQAISVPMRKLDETTDQSTSQTMQSADQSNSTVPSQLQATDNQDVFIIDAQYNEKETRRELVEYKQRILIEQDLMRVENYINEVINALQHYELQYMQNLTTFGPQTTQQQQNFHRQFLNVLTAPIRRNELDLLNMLQTSEIGSYDHFETAQDSAAHPILPVDLYLEIERMREENQMKILYQNGVAELDNESSVIQESVHIHNKAIFDSLNESLMKFRPYGLQGEPMPWSNKNRRLQTKVDTSQVDTERLFYMVKQDVMRWSQTFAGCHPSTIFLYKKLQDHQPNEQQEQFDDELFQETRERRLAQMLAAEVVETEHQWLNYEFEEAQVKIDLSDMILEHLVEEVVIFLNYKNGLAMGESTI